MYNPAAELITDTARGCAGLSKEFIHSFINHMKKYVNGHVHTNGIENFWSLLKRAIRGTYVNVEPYHLHRYVEEQSFRYNERFVGPLVVELRAKDVESVQPGRSVTDQTGNMGNTC